MQRVAGVYCSVAMHVGGAASARALDGVLQCLCRALDVLARGQVVTATVCGDDGMSPLLRAIVESRGDAPSISALEGVDASLRGQLCATLNNIAVVLSKQRQFQDAIRCLKVAVNSDGACVHVSCLRRGELLVQASLTVLVCVLSQGLTKATTQTVTAIDTGALIASQRCGISRVCTES